MNELSGLCAICNKPSRNLNTCQSCGAQVCSEHYDPKSGRCSRCQRGLQI